MSPLQIIRLVFIISKVILGITCIVYFSMLVKFTKNKSNENKPLSIEEQSQLKIFSFFVIFYFIISCIELILRLIGAFI